MRSGSRPRSLQQAHGSRSFHFCGTFPGNLKSIHQFLSTKYSCVISVLFHFVYTQKPLWFLVAQQTVCLELLLSLRETDTCTG